jgi:hypothetical protein
LPGHVIVIGTIIYQILSSSSSSSMYHQLGSVDDEALTRLLNSRLGRLSRPMNLFIPTSSLV